MGVVGNKNVPNSKDNIVFVRIGSPHGDSVTSLSQRDNCPANVLSVITNLPNQKQQLKEPTFVLDAKLIIEWVESHSLCEANTHPRNLSDFGEWQMSICHRSR